MTIQDNTIIQPIPTDELITEKERKQRLVLSADYKNFIVNYNGGIPNEKSFECNKHIYAITRFLCIHEESEDFVPVTYKVADIFSEFAEMLG